MDSTNKNLIISITKKHSTWQRIFLLWLENDADLDLLELKLCFSIFIKNKILLKSDITPQWGLSLLSSKNNIMEEFRDKIFKILHLKKKNIFINSLKTNKYKYLFNTEVESEIHTILDHGISIHAIKYQFFNKLAAFKSPEELLSSLIGFKNSNIEWNKEYYLKKIKEENLNCTIMHHNNNENIFMVQVKDYEACSTIGSQAWCIVRAKKMFDFYISPFKRQFIYFNFDLPIESQESMMGFTCEMNGVFKLGHYKNDAAIEKNTLNIIQQSFSINQISEEEIVASLDKDYENSLNMISEVNLFEFYNYCINSLHNVACDNNSEALFIAANNNSIDVIKLLLRDPSVDAYDRNNILIRKMAYFGHYEIVKLLLLNDEVDVTSHKNETLINSASSGNLKLFKMLAADERVDIHDQNDLAFVNAAGNGHVDILKFYIENDLNIDYEIFNKAASHAARNNQLEVIRYLSNITNAINFDERLLSEIKNINNNEFLTEILQNNNIDLSSNNSSFIKNAAFSGELAIIEFILKQKIYDPSIDDNSPLKYAISNGHIKTAKLLLSDERVLYKLTPNWIANHVMDKYKKFFLEAICIWAKNNILTHN